MWRDFCSLFTLSVLSAVVEARSLLPLLYGMLPGSPCLASPTWGMVTGNPPLPQAYMVCLPELSVLPHSHGAMMPHPHGAMGPHPCARTHANVLALYNDLRSSRSGTNPTSIAHSQNSNQCFEVQVKFTSFIAPIVANTLLSLLRLTLSPSVFTTFLSFPT